MHTRNPSLPGVLVLLCLYRSLQNGFVNSKCKARWPKLLLIILAQGQRMGLHTLAPPSCCQDCVAQAISGQDRFPCQCELVDVDLHIIQTSYRENPQSAKTLNWTHVLALKLPTVDQHLKEERERVSEIRESPSGPTFLTLYAYTFGGGMDGSTNCLIQLAIVNHEDCCSKC